MASIRSSILQGGFVGTINGTDSKGSDDPVAVQHDIDLDWIAHRRASTQLTLRDHKHKIYYV